MGSVFMTAAGLPARPTVAFRAGAARTVGRTPFFEAASLGVYGLGDAGRVSRNGERSDRWHGALGGGIWFALLDRSSTMTITYAAAEERSKVYLQAGFHF